MAQAALIIPLVMGAVSAVGSMAAGNAQSVANQANARNQYQQSETALKQSYVRGGQIADETSRMASRQTAAYGGAGVVTSVGTPLAVMADTASKGELARQLVLYQGRVQAAALQQQGDADLAQGKAAQTAGQYAAGTSLLAGAAKSYSAGGGNIPTG